VKRETGTTDAIDVP